ncbi:hypothetical protein ACIRJO_02760 [Streptomyces sp. NPDC102394]|uniref:hypothetical protein n=1 Tax=Streptomyces sp. NPDC102394 TaxID=3366167 RepID=UPI00380E314D
MTEAHVAALPQALPVRCRQDAAGCGDELLNSRIAPGYCVRSAAGTLTDVQNRYSHRVHMREDGFMDGLSETSHVIGARDFYSSYGALKSPAGAMDGCPRLLLTSLLPNQESPEDRAERRSHLVAAIEDGGERDSTFLPQLMTDIHGLLFEHLFAAGARLDESPAKCAGECACDPKSGCPYGCIPLIHAAHHAVAEVTSADA